MRPQHQISILQPLPVRVYICAFLAVWVGMVVWTTMIRSHGSSIAIGLALAAVGCVFGYRLLRLGVTSDSHGLLRVRNNFGTRALSRDEIEDFRIGNNGSSRLGNRTIQALLRDGTTYRLDVCGAPLGFGASRLSRQHDQLTAWLHA